MKVNKDGVFKIRDLGYLALGAFVVGACSPVAPSVSKLSNAAVRTADSSNASSNLSLPGSNLITSASTDSSSLEDATIHSTVVISRRDIQPVLGKNPELGVTDKQIVSKLTNSGKVDFQHDSDQLKGKEASLLKKSVRIYLVVDADPEKIKELGLDQVEAELNWIAPTKHRQKGHWRLEITKPALENKDPVADAEAHRVLEDLKVQLSEIQVDFN